MNDMDTFWIRACTLSELEDAGRKLVRAGKRKVALFATPQGTRACANRCPHEGYPLVEGRVSDDGRLTCNWHNWKFDLASGANLTGGDALNVYPVEQRGEDIWVQVVEPAREDVAARARDQLGEAMDDDDYPRMARELARHLDAGGDPLEPVRLAVRRTHDRLERGCTHAYGAAADWLDLAAAHADENTALACRLEAIAHMATDTLREPTFPYADDVAPFDADALVAAIEAEDQERGAALGRGACRDGAGWADLEPAFARSALAHYAGFGHAAIYAVNAGRLIAQLGEDMAQPLALALMRYHCVAAREDLIPEFRAYRTARAAWDGTGAAAVTAAEFRGLSVRKALERCLASSGRIEDLFEALLEAGAWNLLHFDAAHGEKTDGKLADNANWLDVTHPVTFAHAARQLCERHPALWPDALLQLALFQGRNAGFIYEDSANDAWRVTDRAAFLATLPERLIDHGEPTPIFACHWLKTARAVEAEVTRLGEAPAAAAETLLAALNRFLNAPLKRRHSLRDARQALAFVREE